MAYNIDFLIAAMIILLLVLWHFLKQNRAADMNNQVFLFFASIPSSRLRYTTSMARTANSLVRSVRTTRRM